MDQSNLAVGIAAIIGTLQSVEGDIHQLRSVHTHLSTVVESFGRRINEFDTKTRLIKEQVIAIGSNAHQDELSKSVMSEEPLHTDDEDIEEHAMNLWAGDKHDALIKLANKEIRAITIKKIKERQRSGNPLKGFGGLSKKAFAKKLDKQVEIQCDKRCEEVLNDSLPRWWDARSEKTKDSYRRKIREDFEESNDVAISESPREPILETEDHHQDGFTSGDEYAGDDDVVDDIVDEIGSNTVDQNSFVDAASQQSTKPKISMLERRQQQGAMQAHAHGAHTSAKKTIRETRERPLVDIESIAKMAKNDGKHMRMVSTNINDVTWKNLGGTNSIAMLQQSISKVDIKVIDTLRSAYTSQAIGFVLKPLPYFVNRYNLNKKNAYILRSLIEGIGPPGPELDEGDIANNEEIGDEKIGDEEIGDEEIGDEEIGDEEIGDEDTTVKGREEDKSDSESEVDLALDALNVIEED